MTTMDTTTTAGPMLAVTLPASMVDRIVDMARGSDDSRLAAALDTAREHGVELDAIPIRDAAGLADRIMDAVQSWVRTGEPGRLSADDLQRVLELASDALSAQIAIAHVCSTVLGHDPIEAGEAR